MSSSPFAFRIEATDGAARRGVMTTAHGDVQTPAFMPVGTQGAVKAILHRDLEAMGAGIILGNTYHLFLRPGDDLIARRGGLHRFIGWTRSILTDSGGYQVFSLAERRRVDEEGVTFRSHLDGRAHLLTPERAVEIQAQLGSDIAMVLDECIANPADEAAAEAAVERTRRWAARARGRFEAIQRGAADLIVTNPGQAQFGIVQGGIYPRLRQASARATVDLGFEAYAIGGLSVGESPTVMYEMVEQTVPALPADRPHYLMGVGTPVDLVEAVARGIDLFDCVLPTRNARNGQLFTRQGPINIKNAQWAEDDRPVDEACGCYTCQHASRAYLRHLFLAGEITAASLNTLHNLAFYLDMMSQIREAIVFRRFDSFRAAFLNAYGARRCV
ncbi:MAG TPA: tRNA guanosine(34) transglycosylase Tgt [Vicinamibacterales bacterium]